MQRFSSGFLAVMLFLFSSVIWAGSFKAGWDAYSSTDYTTALSEWQDLADSGDPDACYGMGLLYGNGFGVDMDDELALKYYGIAAAAGHAEAQYNLGVMHQNGWGVPINEHSWHWAGFTRWTSRKVTTPSKRTSGSRLRRNSVTSTRS